MTFFDRVQTQAHEIQYKRILVSALLLVAEVLLHIGPYTLAWIVGKLFVVGMYVGTYVLGATKLGWQDALGNDSDKAGRPWAS